MDPQAISALRRGQQAQLDRIERRHPELWGISAEIPELATSEGMVLRKAKQGSRDKVMSARRADAFQSLYDARGLSGPQFAVARRYVRDVMLRAGVKESDGWRPTPVDANGRQELVTQTMIDAGGRVERVHAKIGRMDSRLLNALVEPMLRGEVLPWRDVVEAVTRVAEKHRQADRICGVCDNLIPAYEEIDREDLARRRVAPANDNDPRGLRANDG